MLINPGPLQWLRTLFIIDYQNFTFTILYLILIQLYLKPIILYSIVLGMQYGAYVEISEFWQCQAVWSSDTYKQSLILV
jgi:hypothetical protein